MVDDEDLLLTMGQTILSAYGYTRADRQQRAEGAGNHFARGRPQIDLVITDLVMPEHERARTGGARAPGFARHPHPLLQRLCPAPTEEQEHTAYLQKPFTSQDLLLKVKQALTLDEPAPVD